MTLSITPTGAVCGAFVEGADLSRDLSPALVAEIRAHWLEHKVLVFSGQKLSTDDLVRFTRYFGEIGEDPFFGHIEENENIAAVPPAGTVLYGITIPPVGGNTLFADQVAAYEALSDERRKQADELIAIHSAELGYAPDGAYGAADQESGRSMKIIWSEKAREKCQHPFVRTHHETGKRALFSSAAYIQSFLGLEPEAGAALVAEYYAHQTREEFVYSHHWEQDMLVMWDNRAVLHSATGGYDGHDRLLYRTTIADSRF